MAVYKADNGTWYVSARYTNWKGEADRKLKRGFATKKEATEWEQNFFLENAGNLEMTFEAFYELYKKNMKERVKLNTWKTKESVIEGKILPYFRKKRMCDIKPRDVVTWQNALLKMRDENGKPFSPVYLKTIHNQLSAIFNHAVKFYDLPNNPAQKAGNMGKEKSREMLFWTQDEYKASRLMRICPHWLFSQVKKKSICPLRFWISCLIATSTSSLSIARALFMLFCQQTT